MYPRRVKDLPRLETDSEDDWTPLKPKHKGTSYAATAGTIEPPVYCNKENVFRNSNTVMPRHFPKRSSELPPLESDSEEDDDNLNCAILNDSFILTPLKDEPDESLCNTVAQTSKQPDGESADQNSIRAADINAADSSFVTRFNKMGLSCGTSASKDTMPVAIKSEAPACSKTIVAQTASEYKPASDTHLKSMTEGREEAAAVMLHNSEPATTPLEAQFVTPQIRSFAVQRRPRDICSMQSQKTRSAIVNEFRSQKVLFQTPMTVARPPNSCLTNDSISLSLCDTPLDDTPSTSGKVSPPQSAAIGPSIKSKKSLECVFRGVANNKSIVPSSDSEKPDAVANANAQHRTTTSSSETSGSSISASGIKRRTLITDASSKQTTLNINSNQYKVLQKLGAGGSSSVYLAQRQDNGAECALKIVDLQGDTAIVEGYLNETELLAKLQGNPCVVSLYEYQLMQKESKLYMVMEKGDSDLNKILQSYKANLPLYVLMNFWYQMLQAVNYIHQNGVIHSDLKPANFLMINGRLKLIDFGIASNIAVDSTSIIKFSQAGTFNYISPEALTDTSTGNSPIRNQPKIKISTKSDVWSLGCILYLLLYKKTPFSHILSIYAKINAISSPNTPIDYPAIPPYYPPMLLKMVKSCLQRNPKQRPSCADLLRYPFHMVIPIKNITLPPK